jgi:translation initiation factor IF-1
VFLGSLTSEVNMLSKLSKHQRRKLRRRGGDVSIGVYAQINPFQASKGYVSWREMHVSKRVKQGINR